jgi:hypothetical protein
MAGKVSDWLSTIVWLSSYKDPIKIGLEHLGAVIVVAMLVRATLEAASQRELFRALGGNIQTVIQTYLEPLQSSVRPIQEGLTHVTEQLQPLQNSIGSIVDSLTFKIRRIFEDARLFDTLRKNILDPDFVRPYYKLFLTLQFLEGHQDLLKVSVTTEYEVENISGEEKEYEVVSWLDDMIRLTEDPHSHKVGFTEVKVSQNFLRVEHYESREDGMFLLKIPKNSIEPGEGLFVKIDGVQIMRTEDHFVWNLVTVTGKMEISIELKDGLNFDQLVTHPRAMHHTDLNTTEQTSSIWKMRIDHVLLPYQGVEIRWLLNPIQPTASLGSEIRPTASV